MVESIGHRDGRADVLISPEQSKLDEFLNLERPQSKKDVQQICGLAAQMKRWCPGMQVTYPGMQRLCSSNVYFQWSQDLDRELEELKSCLRKHVKISPIDVTRNLILVIDSAPTIGTSYLLLQQKGDDPALGMNFIALDSSNFKKGQLNMCPFEAEVAGLRFAIKKEHHYLVACPLVTVVTDCKSLGPAYQKPWEEIKNGRVMKMFMDCSHINLTFKHVAGIFNSTTDYRSRHPRDSWEATGEEDSPMRMRLGVRSVRAERVDLQPVDIRLEKMAERAAEDQEYQEMIKYLEEETPHEEMNQSSEMFGMNGEREYLGVVKLSNGFKLIVKNESEVLIPRGERDAILQELHSTHLSASGMKKLTRGRMTWKGINKNIERMYDSCESCLTNARAKPHKNNQRCEVIPEALELTVAGEKISADFGEFGVNKLMIVKDRFSGLLRVFVVKDLTMKSAIRGFFQWSHSYGLASEIRTDDGPGFRGEFKEAVEEVGTRHVNSSAYNPSPNGAGERGVGQIKQVLEKLGSRNLLTQEFLNFICFKINSNMNRNTGSALERFFGRTVQTYIPSLFRKEFDQASAIKKRSDEQYQIAMKLGRRSADTFKKQDLVVCQNPRSGKWTVRGRIIETRQAEDGSSRSFLIKTESGATTLRNARFIRHQTKKKMVAWSDVGMGADDAATRGSVTNLDNSGGSSSDDAATRGSVTNLGNAGSSGSGADVVAGQRRSERLAGRNRF